MKDRPIYNLRTLYYLLTQKSVRLLLQKITAETSVVLADVSKWQAEIDFTKMKSGGLAGVICKCGQADYPDPKFGTNWLRARGVLPRGTYWYFDSRVSPQKQAQLWADLIRADPGELPHFADFEENYGGPYGGSRNFRIFLEEFKRLSGLPDDRIAIYTGYYYWIGTVPVAEMDWFGRFDLWLPWYTTNPANVRIPRPWTQAKLLFWQFTDSGDGIRFGVSSRELDLNYFVNGNQSAYITRFNISIGDTPMEEYFIVTSTDVTKYRSLRAGPSVTAAYIGQLPAGAGSVAKARVDDVFTHTETTSTAMAGDRWVHVFEINGAPVDGWMAEIHLGVRYVYLEHVPGPGSDPEPSPLPVLQITVDGGELYETKTIDLNPLP